MRSWTTYRPPTYPRRVDGPRFAVEAWGFAFHERSIHLNWGDRCKIIHLPWDFTHVRYEVMREDGVLVTPARHEYSPPFSDGVEEIECLRQERQPRHGTAQYRRRRR